MQQYETVKQTIKGLSDPFYRVKGYKPDAFLGKMPFLKSANNYRARIEIGGTFFRSRGFGVGQNQISISATNQNNSVTLTIKNHAISSEIMTEFLGVGNGSISNIAIIDKNWNDNVTCTYDGEKFILSNNLGFAIPNSIFRSSILVFVIKEGSTKFANGDTFTIKISASTETFTVPQIMYDPTTDPKNTSPGDEPDNTQNLSNPDNGIPLLRDLVNAKSRFIEMPERGIDFVDAVGTDLQTGRSVRAAGSEAKDWYFLKDFQEAFLKQGDGMPKSPNGAYTGIEITLFKVNNGENAVGEMTEINKVFTWVGASDLKGQWIAR